MLCLSPWRPPLLPFAVLSLAETVSLRVMDVVSSISFGMLSVRSNGAMRCSHLGSNSCADGDHFFSPICIKVSGIGTELAGESAVAAVGFDGLERQPDIESAASAVKRIYLEFFIVFQVAQGCDPGLHTFHCRAVRRPPSMS